MLWPLVRMLLRTYGLSLGKTAFQAAANVLRRRG